eukprot:gnl/TRDRNA2_/TRDRNA2_175618_c8_seq1.p2 gnl/TRDRNA2_/TRDRNA2_175618_c8~~gnl/TRDRNA2_/TRDRNA2_175618_c8_seq1.p2  ORF type:complete len:148 (-),score=18.44 gnl/TRDRNA2_/TRDRNA2_175618_c8_seq1:35-478(-)
MVQDECNAKDLAGILWGVAMARGGHRFSELAFLEPSSVLAAISSQSQLLRMHYQVAMQSLALSGQIVAGFVLLARAESSGLISQWDESCYQVFNTLIEACRLHGDPVVASHVQASLHRLSLIALAPVARSLVQKVDMHTGGALTHTS